MLIGTTGRVDISGKATCDRGEATSHEAADSPQKSLNKILHYFPYVGSHGFDEIHLME